MRRVALEFRRFWLAWILIHAGGGAMIGALEAGGLQFLATLVLTGPVLGLLQGLMLWRSPGSILEWSLVSALGWGLGVQLGILAGAPLDQIVAGLTQIAGMEGFWLNLVNEAVVLTGLGLIQWLSLRRYRRGVAGWIPLSAAAGAVAGGLSAGFCAWVCEPLVQAGYPLLATAIAYGIGWAGYGSLTGGFLWSKNLPERDR